MVFWLLGLLTAVLSWNAPTLNKDNTPLTDLRGYRICFSSAFIPDDKTGADCSITFDNNTTPGRITSPTIDCPHTLCYFRVAAYDNDGNESDLSNQISTLGPAKVIIMFESVSP